MVRSIVCVKQALDVAELKIDRATRVPVTIGVPRKISDFDKNAIEEAVRLKEKHGGTITILTMGKPEAVEAIKEALAMGADDACLVSDPSFEKSDTLATSYVLFKAIQKLGDFDLIFCGESSIDGFSGQIGPRLAERLGIPVATYVSRLELEGDVAKVERDLEEGIQVLEAKTPLLLTVTNAINEPRLPSLMAILKASSKEIKKWSSSELETLEEKVGSSGSAIEWIKVLAPEMERKGIIFKDKPADETAEELANAIVKEGVL
jgi:electron transfer flavoprotein beta subunit